MYKITLAAAASFAAIAFPSAAQAQAEPFIFASGGYHDLGNAEDIEAQFDDIAIDTGSAIFGGVIGVDAPVGQSFFIGGEGNFHVGTDAVDSEYGVAARFGIRDAGGAKYYLRGGYQEINLDFVNIISIDGVEFTDDDFAGIDDTAGDFIVGGGVEFPVGSSALLRVNVDTVGFDSARATAGIGFRF